MQDSETMSPEACGSSLHQYGWCVVSNDWVGSGISDWVFKYHHQDLCKHLKIDFNHLPSVIIPMFKPVGNPPGPAASIHEQAPTMLATGTDVDEMGNTTEDYVVSVQRDKKGRGVDSAATSNPSQPNTQAKKGWCQCHSWAGYLDAAQYNSFC